MKRLSRSKSFFPVFILALSSVFGLSSCGLVLQPWHTQKLTSEFTAHKLDKIDSFASYRRLEDRLFEQLKEKVYSQVSTGPEYALVRYSSGSAADPFKYNPDWNRSFELQTERPVGGILLLHGMSDSPYSLRALGQALNKQNYWVLGIRLPGHGTAPSGLKHINVDDMASAVRLGMEHLAATVGPKPIHIVGYSTGAALALNYTLDTIEGKSSPTPASLVLVSPAIGVHPAAALANFKNRLSFIPGLGSLSWLDVAPEFDPYKYNSFATNAAAVVHSLTQSVSTRIAAEAQSNQTKTLPPILVFKSAVDATVSTDAVVDRLLNRLTDESNELVLFDINRYAVKSILLVADPAPITERLMRDENLPFTFRLVTNENPESLQVVVLSKAPFASEFTRIPLNLAWPLGVISLSHVALTFPPDDPLYGVNPPQDFNRVYLGQMAIKGERNLLRLPADWLLRLRHNPFYEYLETRTLSWIDKFSAQHSTH